MWQELRDHKCSTNSTSARRAFSKLGLRGRNADLHFPLQGSLGLSRLTLNQTEELCLLLPWGFIQEQPWAAAGRRRLPAEAPGCDLLLVALWHCLFHLSLLQVGNAKLVPKHPDLFAQLKKGSKKHIMGRLPGINELFHGLTKYL